MTQIISLNQTTMHAWATGQYQKAVEHYFKLANFTTEKMADGTALHKQWSEYIEANNKLPVEFGNKPLIKPLPEGKLTVKLQPWLELYGTPDCIDSPIIYEFKSGKRSSESYASSWQTRIYAVLATYAGIYIDKAEIHHWDQYTKKHDMSVVWITDQVLKEAYDYIEAIASDMHHYFDQNDLWNKFGHNLQK